jgi:hypothetical protein
MIIVYFLVLENSLVTWDGRNVVALERFNFNSVRLRMNLPLTTEATEIVGIRWGIPRIIEEDESR